MSESTDALERIRRDPLTGLLTLRWLHKAFERVMVTDRSLSVVAFNVDGLKPFNDVYSVTAGDALLRRIAGALTCAAPEGSWLVRTGGDTFAAFIQGIASHHPRMHARAMRASLRNHTPYHLHDDLYDVRGGITSPVVPTMRCATIWIVDPEKWTSAGLIERLDEELERARGFGPDGFASLVDPTP